MSLEIEITVNLQINYIFLRGISESGCCCWKKNVLIVEILAIKIKTLHVRSRITIFEYFNRFELILSIEKIETMGYG